MITANGNEQIHDAVDELLGKYGKHSVTNFIHNLQISDNDFKIGKTRPETLNAYILKVVSKTYNTTPLAILNTKNQHLFSEARMICVAMLRKYSSLPLETIAELYKIRAKSNVHYMLNKMKDLLSIRDHYRDLILRYESIEGQVELFVESFGQEPATRKKTLNIQSPLSDKRAVSITDHLLTASVEENFSLEEPLNFTGEEKSNTNMNNSTLEAPEVSVDQSPFNHAVIERHNQDGFTKILNESTAVEETVIEPATQNAPQPAEPNLVDEYSPIQIDASALETENTDGQTAEPTAGPTTNPNEPGPMKFTSPGNDSPETTYGIPPEMKAKANKFSTNAVTGMLEAFLPRISYGFVEINEREVRDILRDSDVNIQKRVSLDVKKMNAENLETLDYEIKRLLPYIEQPLAEMFTAEKLKNIPPGVALAMYAIGLLVTLYLAMNKMAGERKRLMDDLRAFRDEKRPLF